MPRIARNPAGREALVEKGMELVLRQGYHGTGISEIVAAADVPKGSFYNHFASKEAFVSELVGRYGRRLRETFNVFLESRGDADALAGLTEAYTALLALHQAGSLGGCLIGNLAAEVGAADGQCRDAVRREMDLWAADVTGLLVRGQAEGTVRADLPAAALAEFFWDAWEGALLRAKTTGSTAPLERTLALVEQFFRPVSASSRPAGNR